MPGSAAKVLITERQQDVLEQMAAARTSPVRLAQRAKVICDCLAAIYVSSGKDLAERAAEGVADVGEDIDG